MVSSLYEMGGCTGHMCIPSLVCGMWLITHFCTHLAFEYFDSLVGFPEFQMFGVALETRGQWVCALSGNVPLHEWSHCEATLNIFFPLTSVVDPHVHCISHPPPPLVPSLSLSLWDFEQTILIFAGCHHLSLPFLRVGFLALSLSLGQFPINPW